MNEPKLQGHLRWRADVNAYEAIVTVPGRPRVRRSTGFDQEHRAEAERFLEVLVEELRELVQTTTTVSDPTFREWGLKWVQERQKRGLVAAFDEEAHLEFHAFPELGETKLRDLTKARMLEWVRGLPQHTTDRSGKPLSPRYVHHVAATVRRLMSEAVDRDLLLVSPCVWKSKRDLPAKMDRDPSKRRAGGFQPAEVWALLFDERIPPERRVLYALEFLTGMRTGEAAARRWRDWHDEAQPLGRLEVATAWNTRMRVEGTTKTLVEKVAPVHPILARILRAWKEHGWKEYTGREPTGDDYIVPAERGGPRNASRSNKLFQQDLRTLELRPDGQERRTHYETRSTFRSLALAGGAVRSDLDLITHPSPRQASDLYTRLDVVWPALCRAVASVEITPPRDTAMTRGQVPENERPATIAGYGPQEWRGVRDSNPWPPA